MGAANAVPWRVSAQCASHLGVVYYAPHAYRHAKQPLEAFLCCRPPMPCPGGCPHNVQANSELLLHLLLILLRRGCSIALNTVNLINVCGTTACTGTGPLE